MSQNPALPEENTEEIKTTRTRRTRKTAKDAGEPPAEEKKTVRRRKSVSSTAEDAPLTGEGEEKKVVMRLTCERELQDWEYDAVYDYYDTETVGALVDSIEEEDGHYDPVWVVTFPFAEEQDVMEQKLTDILDAHKEELLSVYEAIKDKEDDYRGE